MSEIRALDGHFPAEGVGGGIECICGWPTSEDFKVHGKGWEPDYNVHLMLAIMQELLGQ